MFGNNEKRVKVLEEAHARHEREYAQLKTDMNASFDRVEDMLEMIRAWLKMSGMVFLAVDDKSGTIRYAFGAWDKLGWSEDELIGETIYKFVHPDDIARTEVELDTRPDSYENEGVIFVNRYRCKCGDFATIEWLGEGGDKVKDMSVGAGRVKLRCGNVRW
jgi:PAS domain S-box-containing protein